TGTGSAHRQHDARHRVEQIVDLGLAIPATLRPEGHGAHILWGEGLAALEVAGDAVGEAVDVGDRVAEGEHGDPLELLALGPTDPVEDLLRGLTGRRVPALVAIERDPTLALAGREGILESLERRVDVGCRVAALAHRERGGAD